MDKNVKYTLNDFINTKVGDLCTSGFNKYEYDLTVDCVREIGSIIKAKERLAVFGDEDVLMSLTVGELAMVLEDYFMTPESPDVILRMHNDAKVLCRDFIRLFSESYDTLVGYDGEPFKPLHLTPSNYFLFNLTAKRYFDELQTGSGRFASAVFDALYIYLKEQMDFYGEKSMYNIITYEIAVTLHSQFEQRVNTEKSLRLGFHLLVLPMALYMRYHEQKSMEDVVGKAKEVRNM